MWFLSRSTTPNGFLKISRRDCILIKKNTPQIEVLNFKTRFA
jgi:hypothetical protein